MNRLEGRVALVTASASGMGRAVVRRLASEGAHVICADINADAVNETVELIKSEGGSAIAEVGDATDTAALEDLFKRIDAEHGKLDILHNHVGMPGAAGVLVSEDEWDLNIRVNMKSIFYATGYAMPLLKKSGKGSVIITSSVSGLRGSPFGVLYSLTKGGLVAYGKSMALVGAPDNIRVNVICPGSVDTPMLDKFFGRDPSVNVPEVRKNYLATIPMGRAGKPEEIAGLVAFLASDDAGFITGQAIAIDGGYTAK